MSDAKVAQECSWGGSKFWAAEGFTEMWGFSAEFIDSTLLESTYRVSWHSMNVLTM